MPRFTAKTNFRFGLTAAAIASLLAIGSAPAFAQSVIAGAVASGPAGVPACPGKRSLMAMDELPVEPMAPCLAIATFADGSSAAERAAIVERAGALTRFDLGFMNGAAMFVPSEEALWSLVDDPAVVRLVPDRRVQAFAKPDKPGNGKTKDGGGGDAGGQVVPSGVNRIGASPGLLAVDGASVAVAIVDTGLDSDHPDLNVGTSCFFPPNSVVGIASCEDDNGHGTHVGGIVAARDNDQDVVGVAQGAVVYSVKVLNANGVGLDSEVLQGLQWVLDSTIDFRVVNMSLGGVLGAGETCDLDTAYPDVIAPLNDAGIIVVAAAGNDRNREVSGMAPAGCTGVVAVASTMVEAGANNCRFFAGSLDPDTESYFTTDGAEVLVSAPGERSESINRGCVIMFDGVLSLDMGGGTTRKAGTSMAAPHVAGVAALMIDKARQTDTAYTPGDIACWIEAGADLAGSAPLPHPVPASDDGESEGIVSAPASLAKVGKACPTS